MYKTLLGILIAVFVIAGAGCDSGGLTQGRTLVVDLLSVARALGRDESMTRQMEQARKQLNDQLTRIGNELEQKLREKETELSGSPDAKKEESKKQLEELTLQANLQLRQTRQLANRKALLFRDSLVEEFRNEVMTVAGRIARERGAAAILAADSELLWYSSDIDITDEVIGVLRARKAQTDIESETGRAVEETAQDKPGDA